MASFRRHCWRCTAEEQERILDITLEEIGGRLPVISGIWADGSANAAKLARMAEATPSIRAIKDWSRDLVCHAMHDQA